MEKIEKKWKKMRQNGKKCGGIDKIKRNGKN